MWDNSKTKRFYRFCKICQTDVLNEVGLKRSTTHNRKNSVLCDALLSSTALQIYCVGQSFGV